MAENIYDPFLNALCFLQPNILLTAEEASWVSSVATLGNPLGSLVSGLVMNLIGRKNTALYLQATTYIMGYILIAGATNVGHLYLGRLLCGMCQVYLRKNI